VIGNGSGNSPLLSGNSERGSGSGSSLALPSSGSSTPHTNTGALTPSSLRPTFANSRDPSPRYLMPHHHHHDSNNSISNNDLLNHIIRPRGHSSAASASGLALDDLRTSSANGNHSHDGNLNRPLDDESIDD
jgi:hypothetical protein